MGAICNCHSNMDENKTCKKNYSDSTVSQDDKRNQLKQWLLAGLPFRDDDEAGQTCHVRHIQPAEFALRPEHEIDNEMVRTVESLP